MTPPAAPSYPSGDDFQTINFINGYCGTAEHDLSRMTDLTMNTPVTADARVIAAGLSAVANALLALRETTGAGILDVANAVTDTADHTSGIADAIDRGTRPHGVRRHLGQLSPWRRVKARRLHEVTGIVTPGQAAHNAWCAEDDWHELDSDARSLWESAALAAVRASHLL